MDLSIIIACYNEGSIFKDSVKEVVKVLDNTIFTYEIILVDDCSRDKTDDIVREICIEHNDKQFKSIFHKENKGRGATVVDGFKLAKGDIIGYIDIDLEIHARYIPSCVLAIKDGADIAIGLRMYKFNFLTIDRYFMSKGYNYIARKTLNIPLKDTESGFKFFNRERIIPILNEVKDSGWFWDTEIMTLSYKQNLKIAEIPCLFLKNNNKVSTVNKIDDSINYLRSLIKFRKYLKTINLY